MPLQAVFFDIDGTLVDSNEFHVMAWDEAFHDMGYRLEKDAIRSQIGKGADQLIPSLVPGAPQDLQHAIADRHAAIFRTRYLKQVRPFPHATDLIEMVHARGKQAILASSAGKMEADHYVKVLKVGPMLSGTISKDDVMNSKPAGDIFAAALARVFPINASETIAIGDTPYDVQGALRSGVKTIALRSGGFSEETLAAAGAAFIYGSVKDLFDHFASSPLQED